MDNLLSPALELMPPDISAWRQGSGGPGSDTPDYVQGFDSGRPGPGVVVSALVHGNELCGAVALDRLLKAGLRPEAGRLSLAFVNVAAFERFSHAAPMPPASSMRTSTGSGRPRSSTGPGALAGDRKSWRGRAACGRCSMPPTSCSTSIP